MNRCQECGSPFDRGCGAKFHDTAPPAPKGFDPVVSWQWCKHGRYEYVDDGAPFCPHCDHEQAQRDPLTLLDQLDRYASALDQSGEYNGSPFQERVRSVLSDAGLFDPIDDSPSRALGAESAGQALEERG